MTTTEVVDAESVATSEVGAALEADPGVLVNSDALASVEEVISEVGTGIDDKGVSVAAWAAKASETKARSLSGRIVRAFVEPGTYFSELKVGHVGNLANRKDPEGYPFIASDEALSQVYLTAVATRAIIFIEADNPRLGTVAFIGVGMTEVSTCEITVREGEHLKKGDQLGCSQHSSLI